MKLTAAALTLCLSMRALAADDGGVAAEGRVRYDCPEAPDMAVAVDGGWYLPRARADRLSCLLAATAAHRDELQKENDSLRADPGTPGWKAWLALGLAMFAGGLVTGLVLKK